MAITCRRVPFILLGVLVLAGCDQHDNPVSPISPTPLPNTPAPVALTITGATSLDRPGATGQLLATATFSDNTSKDVTAEASWGGTDGFVSITGPGLITAVGYGTGTVNARYRTLHATAWIRIAPAGSFLVSGSITSVGGFPLPQTRVEFSSHCGTHATMTDGLGAYILAAEGLATMRVEHDGFYAQVKQLTVGTDGRVDVELQPLVTAGDLTGTYRLTVTASPSCVLPAEVMQRSYDARILDTEQELWVRLSGADMVTWAGEAGFTGHRDGNTVRFVVRDTFDDGYNFIERIDPGRDLYYAGTATGTADRTRIVATFNGSLVLRAHSGGSSPSPCVGDHRFEFTRSE